MTQIEQQNVPVLRFPGFEGDWESTTLGRISAPPSYGMNAAATNFDGTHKYIRITDISDDERTFCPSPLTSPKPPISAEYRLKAGDIVFARTGASTGKSYLYKEKDGDLYFAGFLIRFPIVSADPKFVFAQTLRSNFIRWIAVVSVRSGQPGINAQEYSGYDFKLPPLPEQSKIAGFLGAVDERIAQMTRKKALLEDYKKGCMQQLFSQSIRFKDDQGNDFPDWEEKPLRTFLTETKKKSDRTEPVFSVSVHKGLIDQIEHLGRSFSADDTGHYNRVEPGDIVYTKSPTGDFPLGIIKQSCLDKPVIVSPLYGVFRPETADLGYWLHVYFESHINTENYLKPIIQKGAKNTINITNKTFLSAKLKVPAHQDEQRKIAGFLKAIDTKIELVAQELGHAQSFKKGLLQQMFV